MAMNDHTVAPAPLSVVRSEKLRMFGCVSTTAGDRTALFFHFLSLSRTTVQEVHHDL